MKKKHVIVLAVVLAGFAVGLVVWLSMGRSTPRVPVVPQREAMSPEGVGLFYTSLAALDVADNQRAAELLEAALEVAPSESALWANLAVARLRTDDLASAEQAVARARTISPEFGRLDEYRAILAIQAGDYEAAVSHWHDAVQRQPADSSVRFALATTLERIGGSDADAELAQVLADLVQRHPGNLVLWCEQAALAARSGDVAGVRQVFEVIASFNVAWPEFAAEQLAAVQQGDAARGADDVNRAVMFFHNQVKQLPIYQRGLDELGVFEIESVRPVRVLQNHDMPVVQSALPDVALSFDVQAVVLGDLAQAQAVYRVHHGGDTQPMLVGVLSPTRLAFADGSTLDGAPGVDIEASSHAVATADLNHDFLEDIVVVGTDGVRIALQSPETNAFSWAPMPTAPPAFSEPMRGVMHFDIDADGDIDLILLPAVGSPRLARNNGDMTFTLFDTLAHIPAVRQLAFADLDNDGDIDIASLSDAGVVQVWPNLRNGKIAAESFVDVQGVMALTVADRNRDGQFELIVLDAKGQVRSISPQDGKDITLGQLPEADLATGPDSRAAASDIFAADFDNNGEIDFLVAAGVRSHVWLGAGDDVWQSLDQTVDVLATIVDDMDGDGLLDVVGMKQAAAAVAMNKSTAGYHWQIIRPRATPNAGDQRINSFGIGAEVELRTQAASQIRMAEGPRIHFGLGVYERTDVVRIVWPNGAMQAEFEMQSDDSAVAIQRLKGSCPWVFAFDGEKFQFVTDFLWRSPLGLRINGQDTAGVIQTGDWVKIPGDMIATSDGAAEIRITADLWETHFFDHVSLMSVDHAADTEVHVDERFSPMAPPALKVITTQATRWLTEARDDSGRDVGPLIAAIDGRYVDQFELGRYQGLAKTHWVEFDLPSDALTDNLVLIGHGWIYPTDSSINVAMSQGSAPRPYGLILEQEQADGTWQVVSDQLGFPAGKKKTVVIDVQGVPDASRSRFRLRTNLEVYWDALGWSRRIDDAEIHIQHATTRDAELRFRGFSALSPLSRRQPDIPDYQQRVAVQPRWRDLEGFYTRFGDVLELLEHVDDRYVIMNAGDELSLTFDVGDAVQSGLVRDYVLIGDGWVKDGDYATAFSRTVRPLPSHDTPAYAGPLTPLHEDPVYLRYPDDWATYHTRYVTPRRFDQGLFSRPSK